MILRHWEEFKEPSKVPYYVEIIKIRPASVVRTVSNLDRLNQSVKTIFRAIVEPNGCYLLVTIIYRRILQGAGRSAYFLYNGEGYRGLHFDIKGNYTLSLNYPPLPICTTKVKQQIDEYIGENL